jgi:hypothetical protein
MTTSQGKGSRGHPVMLRILRWLMEEEGRTLPDPEDAAGVQALAQAVNTTPDVIRTLLAQSKGEGPDADTLRILR